MKIIRHKITQKKLCFRTLLWLIPKNHLDAMVPQCLPCFHPQGFKKQALAVSTDPEHKFELAFQLGDLKLCHQLAEELNSESKWKQLSELATLSGDFKLAQECLHKANDHGGLLLMATAAGKGFICHTDK